MEIRCRCSKCEAKFKAEEASAGLKIQCPRCGGVVVVPPVARAIEDPTSDSVPRAQVAAAFSSGGGTATQTAPVEVSAPANPWPLRIGLGVLGFVAIGALLFVVYLVNRPVPKTAIMVHWPVAERKAGSLDVSGNLIDIGKRDPIIVHVDEGPHRVRLQRPGFEPVVWSFTLMKGEQKKLSPEWQETKK